MKKVKEQNTNKTTKKHTRKQKGKIKKVQKQIKQFCDRTEEEKKVLQTKLNRVIGQLNGIKKMVEDDRNSDDLLMQLCAVESGIETLKFLVYKEVALKKLEKSNDNNFNAEIEELLTTIRRY